MKNYLDICGCYLNLLFYVEGSSREQVSSWRPVLERNIERGENIRKAMGKEEDSKNILRKWNTCL